MRSTGLTLRSVVEDGSRCRLQVLLTEVLKIVVSSRVRCVWFDDKKVIHYKYHAVVIDVLLLSFMMKNHGRCHCFGSLVLLLIYR
jgi:hypothetical protein